MPTTFYTEASQSALQTGTLTNITSTATGLQLVSNPALTFNGTNQYVTVTAVSTDWTAELTVEFWFQSTKNTSNTTFIRDAGNMAVTKYFDQQLYSYLNVAGTVREIARVSSASWTSSTWTHFAFTYKSTVAGGDGKGRAYINGAIANTSTSVYTGTITVGIPEFIACSTNTSAFTAGKMDEVRVWNVQRTSSEITASYQTQVSGSSTGLKAYWRMDEGTGNTLADTTGNGNTGTVSSGCWTSNYSFTGDRVSLGQPLSSLGTDPGLTITWESTVPTGTTLTVSTEVTDTSTASGTAWVAQTSGSLISNIPAGDLTGKYLWIKEALSTTYMTSTVTLSSLSITYSAGDWGVFLQEYEKTTAAGTGTTSTNLYIPNHGLAVGDAISNETRTSVSDSIFACRRVLSATDTSNLTVAAVSLQTASDSIRLYKHNDVTSSVKTHSLQITKRNDRSSMLNLTFVGTTAWEPHTGQDIQVREDTDIIYGGTVKSVQKRMVFETTACSTILYDVYSEGYNAIPARRTVTVTYDDTTAGTIVQDMLEDVLYDELVASGNITSGQTFVEYDATKNVRAIFDDMADASGCKWYIDNSRNLYFVSDDTVASAAHSLYGTGAYTSFWNVRYEEQTEEYRNRQFVIGGLADDGWDAAAVETNATQINERRYIEGSTGVYGDVFEDSKIETDEDATTVAETLLKQYGSALPSRITFNSLSTDWEPNTMLTVDIDALGIDESTYLIEEVTMRDFTGKHESTFLEATVYATQRDSADFGSHSKEDFVTYFGRIVEFAKEGNKAYNNGGGQTILYSGTSVVSGGGFLGCVNDTNTAAISLNTSTETTACELTVDIPIRCKAFINFSCEVSCTAACSVTAKTYVDSAAQTYQPTDYLDAAKNYTFSYHDTIDGISGGTGVPFSVTLQSDVATGAVAISHAVLTILLFVSRGAQTEDIEDLLLYYRFDDSLFDSSGNGRTGSVSPASAAATYAAGYINNCFSFDTSQNKCVSIPGTDSFDDYLTNNQPFTICAWVKPTGTVQETIFEMEYTGNGINLETGPITMFTYSSGTVYKYVSASGTNDGNWHFVAARYSGTAISLSVDNGGWMTTTDSAVLSNTGTYTSFYVGLDSTGTLNYFSGLIDEFRIYSRALTDDEVTTLYSV